MTDEWYEIAYVGFERAFLVGQRQQDVIEVELNELQKEKLYDFNQKQSNVEFKFLRRLLNEG